MRGRLQGSRAGVAELSRLGRAGPTRRGTLRLKRQCSGKCEVLSARYRGSERPQLRTPGRWCRTHMRRPTAQTAQTSPRGARTSSRTRRRHCRPPPRRSRSTTSGPQRRWRAWVSRGERPREGRLGVDQRDWNRSAKGGSPEFRQESVSQSSESDKHRCHRWDLTWRGRMLSFRAGGGPVGSETQHSASPPQVEPVAPMSVQVRAQKGRLPPLIDPESNVPRVDPSGIPKPQTRGHDRWQSARLRRPKIA